jgi:dTDP-4-amino-4,6-dideoxygalactose transaminase
LIPYINLAAQHLPIKAELLAAVDRVLSCGDFILGEELEAFEAEFAAYCGVRFATGVASGTDALVLALRALGVGPGHEVVTVPNSFVATAAAIALAGARPVFVDVRDDYNLDPEKLESAISPRTRAILPVHLTGRPADMDAIQRIADAHNLPVVEDAAQAVGAKYKGRRVGSWGRIACFSLHPLKNLSACGDGGVVTTSDESIYRYLVQARNHGLRDRDSCGFWGMNSRLDTLHAAVLRVKLKYLDGWIEARRANARSYREQLADVVHVPDERSDEYAVYHTFVIQAERRDELQQHLRRAGVETKVHYPVPIHLQEAARGLGYRRGDFPTAERQAARILSLPVYPGLTEEQLAVVASSIREFCRLSPACSALTGR